ncbi:MAG TPA: glutamine-synthetase adenylyltransferase, partial [Acetobacteraceae bacterium]|nr:glutamine-synthetase adenylyltransferase [Acetobacteraceae bacterium]
MPERRRTPPLPYDREAAERLAARFAELSEDARRFAAGAEGAALLAAIGGNSPFLSDLAVREPATLLDAVAGRGLDAALADALGGLRRLDPGAGRDVVGAALRVAKRRVALIAAAADIAGRWPLDRVTGALSAMAEAAVGLACAHLLGAAIGRGELRPFPLDRWADPEAGELAGSGLCVLGMGKLGAQELNYSSDIDLMLLFDPHAAAYHEDRAGACYVRIGRDLVRLLEERTADGYVFRTDLRLRPD